LLSEIKNLVQLLTVKHLFLITEKYHVIYIEIQNYLIVDFWYAPATIKIAYL